MGISFFEVMCLENKLFFLAFKCDIIRKKERAMEEYLAFAKEIAKEAGKIMLHYFHGNNGASYKGDRSIVTLADKEINTYLIERVKETFPTHCVDGEEEQFGKSQYVWVCDPVDGTAMYNRQNPLKTKNASIAT